MAKTELEADLIRELAKLLDETGLTEIEMEREGLRLRVARQAAPTASSTPVVAVVPGDTAAPMLAAFDTKHPGIVASPMVGTAYRAAEPGARPFVDVGTKVLAGQTLLVIEAMKVMNQIPAPRAGTVTQVLFEDGQPVEFGEPLMIVD